MCKCCRFGGGGGSVGGSKFLIGRLLKYFFFSFPPSIKASCRLRGGHVWWAFGIVDRLYAVLTAPGSMMDPPRRADGVHFQCSPELGCVWIVPAALPCQERSLVCLVFSLFLKFFFFLHISFASFLCSDTNKSNLFYVC